MRKDGSQGFALLCVHAKMLSKIDSVRKTVSGRQNFHWAKLRLPDELKARVARAAKLAGTTSHNFILEAIAEKTDQQERYDAFQGTADKRHADIAASGQTIPWDAMRAYLMQRIQGNTAVRPTTRKLSR